jgi:hypothetical protein
VPNYSTPGIYIEELPGGPRPIQAVGTSTAGFVGEAPNPEAHVNRGVPIDNWSQFVREFVPEGAASTALSNAVFGFFQNGGRRCYVVNVGRGGAIGGGGRTRVGLGVLEEVDEVAIVAAPGYADADSYETLLGHCELLKDRVAILDPPAEVPGIEALTRVATMASTPEGERPARGGRRGGAEAAEGSAGEPRAAGEGETAVGLRARPSDSGFGAYYFPRIRIRDPLPPNQVVDVPPSGHVAGIWARTDAARGVHKAPANEVVRGALDLTYRLTDQEQGVLNANGVNCIRFFTREGIRVWGARTLAGASSEWNYLNVRRLFTMIEESIAVSTRWIVFEPNDRTLWKSIRRDISAFLTRVWRDGALMGATPEEAFFVQCDEETNPPEVIDAGEVHTVIGVAPVKPAEFIVFRISQSAGGAEIEAQGGARG